VSSEFEHLTAAQLLKLWSRVMAELREREVIRSSNNPVGDYCEKLVADHFGVKPIAGSNRDYDLVRKEGVRDVRVQVKGRRVTSKSPYIRHWSAMRGVDEHRFDEVVAVALNEDFSLLGAWTVPWEAAKRLQHKNNRLQAHVLPYNHEFRDDPDVTALELSEPDG
jgi:hypothetical protein